MSRVVLLGSRSGACACATFPNTQAFEYLLGYKHDRPTRKLIGYAAFAIAVYGWGMLVGTLYPVLHPIGGSLRGWYVVLIALAGGNLLVGIVGVADPRFCFAIARSTKEQPVPYWARLVGWGLYLSGGIAGGCLAYLMMIES